MLRLKNPCQSPMPLKVIGGTFVRSAVATMTPGIEYINEPLRCLDDDETYPAVVKSEVPSDID